MVNPEPTLSTEMENLPHLPEEILLEIFSRLPTKSAGRCRCLSTTWRANLSKSKFALLHFTHHKEQRTTGLIYATMERIQESRCRFKVYTIPQHGTGFRPIELPTASRYRITGSCNGLVLLVAFPDESLLLLNPLSLDMVAIPHSGWDLEDMVAIPHSGWDLDNNVIGKLSYHGLGYDSVTHDFKIAKFSRLSYDHKVVDLYSVKNRVWKRIVFPSRYSPAYMEEFYAGVFMNGSIHWHCRTSPGDGNVIVAFDLTDEVFSREIRVPCESFMLFNHCGYLYLINLSGYTRDVWIMKEYGLNESWTKIVSLYTIGLPLFAIGDNILFSNDGTKPSIEFEYSFVEVVGETMVVNRYVSGWMYSGATFVHSLFSPSRQHDDGSV